MKFLPITFTAIFATKLLAAPTETNTEGVFSLPISRKYGSTDSSSTGKTKRDTSLPITNRVVRYVAQIGIGTPAQEVEVYIDSGSSNTWVFAPETGKKPDQGVAVVYNSSKSSTYEYVSGGFRSDYVNGSAHGDWVSDTITAGGATVKNQRFATVTELENLNDLYCGILGLSYKIDEGLLWEYDNFPASLYKQGVTKSYTYSLYLDNIEAPSGNVLFGGYDRAKFTGDLFELDAIGIAYFKVKTTIEGYGDGFDGILDSGTPEIYVPDDVASALAADFGAKMDGRTGYYLLDEKPTKGLTFDFGKGNITVPASELALDGSFYGLGDKKYVFPFISNTRTQGLNILGDVFLRSAYTFYDLKDRKVSLAQASYSNESDIVVVTQN